jgi:hypothetical protein
LLARYGPEFLGLYRKFLAARVELFIDYRFVEERRGAVVLLVECARRATSVQTREVHLQRVRDQAKCIGSDELIAYVAAETNG